MFTTLIVQPIFNLLVLIYALIPGHNFGFAIIIFTILVRLALWPLLKKQLHQTRAMKSLQPEIKKIKAATKGNRQKEQQLTMELYKERGINPFSSFGVLLIQIPIFLGLYSGIRRVVEDPHQMLTFSYPFIQKLPWMQHLAHNIHEFDATLFGIVNLTRPALGPKGVYWPAMIIVVASCIAQYYQSKQLMGGDKDSKGLRAILKEAGGGKQAEQADINAAVGRSTLFMMPAIIFIFTVSVPSALSLYWLVSGLVAFIQQSIILREDSEEMEVIADSPDKKAKADKKSKKSDKTSKNVAEIAEAEVVDVPKVKKQKTAKKKKSSNKKRRKK